MVAVLMGDPKGRCETGEGPALQAKATTRPISLARTSPRGMSPRPGRKGIRYAPPPVPGLTVLNT
jgi:hypothetical protein